MEGRRLLRTAACLLVLAVLVHGRSVSPDDGKGLPGEADSHGQQQHQDHDRHRHHRGHRTNAANAGVQLMKYDVGDPEFAVKVKVGTQEDTERRKEPPPSQWKAISDAAQAIGKAAQVVTKESDDHQENDDVDIDDVDTDSKNNDDADDDDDDNDDDDDDDDADDDDSEWGDDEESDEDPDDMPYLKNPHYQVELTPGDEKEDALQLSGHGKHSQQLLQRLEDLPVIPDVYTEDEILKIEGTPAPALITSEEADAPHGVLLDTEQLMGDDSAAAERLLRDGGARPWKEFKPVRMPTQFESYDVDPADGVITLQELVNITGAKVNVHRAFNASDKNGDGLLDRNEFYAAPWKLGPNWRHIPEQEVELSKDTHDSSDEEDEEDYEEDYDEDEDDENEDDDEWDEWDTWEDDPEFWDDVEDADIF